MKFDVMENLFPTSSRKMLSQDGAGGWNSIFTQLLGSMRAASGNVVGPDAAMRQSTVWACIRVLSETMAQFPVHVYRRLPNGQKTIAYEHPLNIVLARRPNPWQTSFEFREMMQGHLALRGNAFAHIIPGGLGSVTELWPLHPDRVRVVRLSNMRLQYIVTMPNGREDKFAQEQIFHLRGLSSDGLMGMSPIAYARDTIGLNLAAENYGAKFFANSARPSGLLTTDAPAMKQADIDLAKHSWHEANGGDNNQSTAVLFGGLKWQTMSMTNDDAQFIATLGRGDKQIAKIFRMQPHKVGIMDDATFSNIEEQNREFIGDTMLPWCRRWEEAIARDLIADDETYYVRFNFDGLLRANAAARTAFYQSAINFAWMTPNEVRELEDLPPYEDGDEFWMQGATVPVSLALNPPAPALPAPVVQPTAEDKQAAEENEQAHAKVKGELLAENKLKDAQLASMIAELARRDQVIASTHEQTVRAELEVEHKANLLSAALANSETTAASLLEATEALTAAESELQAQEQHRSELETQRNNLESRLATLFAESDALRSEAETAKAALQTAADGNLSLMLALAGRMAGLESENVIRLTKKKNFATEASSFYGKHAARLVDALGPLVEQRRALGCFSEEAPLVVTWHIAESKDQLAKACGGMPEQLQERVLSCVAGWEGRAEALIEKLTTKKEPDHVEDSSSV